MKSTISSTQAKKMINDKLSHFFGVTPETASIEQFYKAVAMIVRDELAAMNSDFRHTAERQEVAWACARALRPRACAYWREEEGDRGGGGSGGLGLPARPPGRFGPGGLTGNFLLSLCLLFSVLFFFYLILLPLF